MVDVAEAGARIAAIRPNETVPLRRTVADLGGRWVERNTAFVVVHGIGHQFPLSTLDAFAHGLADAFRWYCGREDLVLEHKVRAMEGGFDNFIRLRRASGGPYLDLHEYYWASETEDRAGMGDIQRFVAGVCKQAKRFYELNRELGVEFERESIFLNEDGSFNAGRYRLLVGVVPRLLTMTSRIGGWLSGLAKALPVVGPMLGTTLESWEKNVVADLANLLGDVTIYNTTDRKSKFFPIRQHIRDGAVRAVLKPIFAAEGDGPAYDRVFLAGHSLGSQIAFEAVNRINNLAATGSLPGVSVGADLSAEERKDRLVDVLQGFVTFGSPLDKTAFFLREQAAEGEIFRRQMLAHYHGFKQRDWARLDKVPEKYRLRPCMDRLLDDLPWRNYFDKHDYVSGGLDFYEGVTNVDCAFPRALFTHSNYWTCEWFYADLIGSFLCP